MKICNAEIIKLVKELEVEKADILAFEARNRKITYQKGEEKLVPDYNFGKVRDEVKCLNERIRKLKHILSVSNNTTIVDEFGITIGECLVYMAQLNTEKTFLELMSRENPKSRATQFGGAVEYTELTYSIEDCKKELSCVNDLIKRLQIAIDRTNLTNLIEID